MAGPTPRKFLPASLAATGNKRFREQLNGPGENPETALDSNQPAAADRELT